MKIFTLMLTLTLLLMCATLGTTGEDPDLIAYNRVSHTKQT